MVETVAAWAASAAAAATAAAGVGASAAVTAAVHAVVYYGVQVAITAGVSAALAGAVGTPDVETAKGSRKQSIPPRIRAYARRRLGGAYLLWEAQGNHAYDVVAFQSDRAEAIETILSHDAQLVVQPDGWVEGGHGYGAGNNDLIHMEWRLGLATETAYPAIVAALGGSGIWTTDCRGDGIASLGVDYRHAKKENLIADFPNGEPVWSAVGRWSRIWDPRIAGQERLNPDKVGFVHTASGNLAQQILDFCCHPTGMAMDYETEIAPALEHWKGELDICDEAVPLKAGGTEPRYWGSGYYAFPDEPQNTLDKMLAACDGKLLRDEFGVWRLWVGKLRAPTVHLTDADIADYDLQGDAAAFDAVNEIVPKFISEAHDWSAVAGTPWRSQGDIDDRGRLLTRDLPLEWCNSGPMSTRLAKREVLRQLAQLRGVLTGKLSCARALGHRWIAVDIADLDMAGVVIEAEKGGKTSFSTGTVHLPFVMADPAADEWDPETEEDDSGVPDRPDIEELDPPTLSSVTPYFDALGGGEGARLHCVGSGPDRSDLTWYVRWKATGGPSYSPAEVTDETAGAGFSGDSGFVPSDQPLDVQIGYQTGAGGIHWSATFNVTASTDALAPPPPTGLTVYIDTGDVMVQASAPNVTRVDHIRFWRAPAGDAFADAVSIGTEPTAPGQGVTFNAGLFLSGDYLIWATAETVADLASVPAGPFPLTV